MHLFSRLSISGLKKVSDFSVTSSTLRHALFERLYDIGQKKAELTDIDKQTVVQLCVLLARGSHMYR